MNNAVSRLLCVWVMAVATTLAAQSIEIYRARHRPAAELVSIARSGLGADGEVTLDARTASLVLNGSPDAIRRTLALLEQLDRPLRQIVVTSDIRQVEDLETLGVDVAWKTSLGPLSVGTLPLGPNGFALRVEANRSSGTTRASSRLRLTQGSTGVIRTGKALPVLFEPYWGTKSTTSFATVETGFEAKARVLEGDLIHLELRPFAGRIGDRGELNYLAVATSVTLSAGESIILAETTRSADSTDTDLTGAQKKMTREQQVVLITADLEN